MNTTIATIRESFLIGTTEISADICADVHPGEAPTYYPDGSACPGLSPSIGDISVRVLRIETTRGAFGPQDLPADLIGKIENELADDICRDWEAWQERLLSAN